MKKLFSVFIFFFCSFIMHSQELIIEGIFYWDKQPIEVHISNGKIIHINRLENLKNPNNQNVIISPGFIDNQVNGYLSYSFVGEDLTQEKIEKITKAFWQKGITTYVPTLTSEGFEIIHKNLGILKKSLYNNEISPSIPGFHLEGPYISPYDGFRGAHPAAHIRNPDWQEFKKWYEASGENIIEVTVAPEMEGAIDFIEKCQNLGILIAVGHTNASASQMKAAVDAGATLSTHLGNGCANSIHRHDNPIWPQLADDRLAASLIVDGFHLRPEEVQTFYKVKGNENTILVSDLVRLAGSSPGKYRDFGTEVVVTEDGKVMMPSQNVLAGASFLITAGIENVMKFTQCSLGEAIHMASRNPARMLNLNDRGEIKVGKRADIVMFTLKEGKIEVQQTILAGKVVYTQK